MYVHMNIIQFPFFIYYRKYLSDSLNGAIEHFDICFYISVCLMYCIAMYPYESYE